VWPANLALFVYVLTHYVETVRLSRLSRWPRGYTPDRGARGPRFSSWRWQAFLCMLFCFVVVLFVLYKINIHINVCNSFCNVNSWRIIRVLKYRPSIVNVCMYSTEARNGHLTLETCTTPRTVCIETAMLWTTIWTRMITCRDSFRDPGDNIRELL